MNDSDLDKDKWLGVFKSVGQYGVGDKRAPYKPLLILWLIARLSTGGDPEVRFRDAESELKKLLAEFRVGRTEPQPKYPFVYLGSSPKLWQVTDEEGHDIFEMSDPLDESSSTPAREMVTFLREEATGRVSEPFIEAIKDTQIRESIIRHLLNAEFPETTHEDVLGRIGLHLAESSTSKRDPRFRETVLRAYERTCSFCDFAVFLLGNSVGIEAAHLKMHSKSGAQRDRERNSTVRTASPLVRPWSSRAGHSERRAQNPRKSRFERFQRLVAASSRSVAETHAATSERLFASRRGVHGLALRVLVQATSTELGPKKVLSGECQAPHTSSPLTAWVSGFARR